MAWAQLEPIARRSHPSRAHGVMISARHTPKFGRSTITISFRPQHLPEVTWLKHGANCSIALGNGDDIGRIRITPGGKFEMICTSKGVEKTVFVRMPPLSMTAPVNRRPEAATFDYDAGWCEVDLPDWALKPEDAARRRSLVTAKAAPAAKLPYRGILAQTPMPHAGRS